MGAPRDNKNPFMWLCVPGAVVNLMHGDKNLGPHMIVATERSTGPVRILRVKEFNGSYDPNDYGGEAGAYSFWASDGLELSDGYDWMSIGQPTTRIDVPSQKEAYT